VSAGTGERRRRGSVTTALTLVVGVLLVIAAVAGFIIVPEHVPTTTSLGACPGTIPSPGPCRTVHTGFASQSVYDAARIGTWAALIIGSVLIVLGLIRFALRTRAS
jgi:hypothetical protein